MNAMSEIKATLSERLAAARQRAMGDGLPVRRKDGALYDILAECLGICEHVEANGLHEQLKGEIRVSVDCRGQSNAGRGRRYVETTADTFILVARAVLEGVDNRNSVYRYALTLREAARRQISSRDLVKWLSENGGVNALYRTRPVTARKSTTRTLNLRDSIEVPKREAFTLTLIREDDGFFRVLGR